MEVKTKILNEEAVIPYSGSQDAAGYDLYAVIDGDRQIVVAPHTTVKIHTGLSFEIPKNYFGAICPRSGLATKEGLRPANTPGVIDPDYRGEIIVAMHNDTDEMRAIQHHERVAQLILIPYERAEFVMVNELGATERGAGGFGSTGYTTSAISRVLGSAT